MSFVWTIQHVQAEGLGSIAGALHDRNIEMRPVRIFADDVVPRDMAGASGLIVMGGPMGVYDMPKYPFLRNELLLIEDALSSNIPVLGICLGSQLLAAALGQEVKPSIAGFEIGWWPVNLTPDAKSDELFATAPADFVPLHWHQDVFALPKGATGIAYSQKTEVQAFRYGSHAYGLLFHLEVTGAQVLAMTHMLSEGSKESTEDQKRILNALDGRLSELRPIAETVFGRWASVVAKQLKVS